MDVSFLAPSNPYQNWHPTAFTCSHCTGQTSEKSYQVSTVCSAYVRGRRSMLCPLFWNTTWSRP